MTPWQQELQSAYRTPIALLKAVNLEAQQLPYALCEQPNFSQLVTQSFVDNIQPGNPNDPLLLQVLARASEDENPQKWPLEALGEAEASPVPGLLHKYHGRVLLLAHGSCAINCRYCFRRNFPYADHHLNQSHLDQALSYIHGDTSIQEVILSGGDPLLLNQRKLEALCTELSQIPHLTTLRIHSRLPVVLPSRFDHALLTLLSGIRLKVVVVWHSNHAQELGRQQAALAKQLADHRIVQLNQSVLLKAINDCSETLVILSHRLFELGIMPYYLHTLDRVAGTQAFACSDHTALQLHQEIRGQLPGYLVPRLVREVPHQRHSKQPIG